MRHFAVLLIRFYQEFTLPRKGFSCANRVYTGQDRCSEATAKSIMEVDCFKPYHPVRTQFSACKAAAESNRNKKQETRS